MTTPASDPTAASDGAAQADPTAEAAGAARPPERHEHFPVDGAVEVEIHLGSGSLRVELLADATAVEVSVVAGQGSWWQQGWSGGLSGVLAMLGAQATDTAAAPSSAGGGTEALAATQIAYSPTRGRLIVRGPQMGPARAVPLHVRITAPAESHLRTRTGSAPVEVTGTAASVDLSAGSGDVTVQDVKRGVDVRTGSGAVRAGRLAQGGRIRTGSGDLVIDAALGDVDLTTGSGDLRIGIAAGVLAELDVRSGAGTARSELPLTTEAAAGGTARVRARTGSGNAVVHAAR